MTKECYEAIRNRKNDVKKLRITSAEIAWSGPTLN